MQLNDRCPPPPINVQRLLSWALARCAGHTSAGSHDAAPGRPGTVAVPLRTRLRLNVTTRRVLFGNATRARGCHGTTCPKSTASRAIPAQHKQPRASQVGEVPACGKQQSLGKGSAKHPSSLQVGISLCAVTQRAVNTSRAPPRQVCVVRRCMSRHCQYIHESRVPVQVTLRTRPLVRTVHTARQRSACALSLARMAASCGTHAFATVRA